MPALHRPALALSALLAAVPAALAAQAGEGGQPRDDPVILGVVVDRESREPLEDVAVTLRFAEDRAGRPDPPPPVLTDERGRFVFADGAPAGLYHIEVARIGYGSVTDSIEFDPALGLRVEVELVQDAVELEPLLVVAEARSRYLESNGFYDRRRRGFGSFVTRDEIEQRGSLQVSDLFRRMAGVRMSPGGRGGGGVVLLRGGCVADVYVDGVRTVPPFQVDALLQPTDLDAIEVYRGSQVPAEFGTTTCGVVAIWTHVPNPGTRGNPFTWGRLLAALGFVAAAFLLTR